MKSKQNKRKGYRSHGFKAWLIGLDDKWLTITFVVVVLLYVWLAGSSID